MLRSFDKKLDFWSLCMFLHGRLFEAMICYFPAFSLTFLKVISVHCRSRTKVAILQKKCRTDFKLIVWNKNLSKTFTTKTLLWERFIAKPVMKPIHGCGISTLPSIFGCIPKPCMEMCGQKLLLKATQGCHSFKTAYFPVVLKRFLHRDRSEKGEKVPSMKERLKWDLL